jgi:hypothetical protein
MNSTRIGTMFRLTAVAVGGLVVAAGASAAGPGWSTTESIASHDGKFLYEAVAHKGRTTVAILRNAARVRTVKLRGNYGVPVPTNDGTAAGLSHDGRTLVLARMGAAPHFAVLDTGTLHRRRAITLRGQFTFDALSPDGSTLFLIQHLDPRSSADRYYVRAYDVRAGRLLKQIVFDAREKGEVMTGWAVTRATGPSGRWVYTLYGRSNGTLFVHALDTVDRHAVCIDLPRRVANDDVFHVHLKLKQRKLVVGTAFKRLAVIDTQTLRVRT